MRVERYSLADKAHEELTRTGFSSEVAEVLVASHPNLRKGRRSRLYSTKQEIPLESGQTPWPAPYLSALVFEKMLKKMGIERADLIITIITVLGGSPDQLTRYRNRLA